MTLQTVQTIRLALGVWTALAIAYAVAWPLYFLMPLLTCAFLSMPTPWFGWKMATQLMLRLAFSLLLGLIISEVFLALPALCILLYALLLFTIYYHDTPTAPPMAALFMTLGITLVPVMGLQGSIGSHVIVYGFLGNMALGLVLVWLFHSLLPNSMAQEITFAAPAKPAPPPTIPRDERIRLALVSTLVALSAITLFFSLNLSQYALAMINICFMAGTPSTNNSIKVMKENALATGIGGIAIIVAFNLLVAVPTYTFLLVLTLCCTLLFSQQIFSGAAHAKAFASGFTTFLVLLGSSTGVDQIAVTNFYLRIAQILFAGLFTLVALIAVEHFLRPVWLFRRLSFSFKS